MTTHLVANRQEALRVGFEATDWPYPISFEDYAMLIEPWSVQAIVKDDVCIGAVYKRGDELHVSIKPEWRKKWLTKGLLKELFSGAKVTTKVTPGHEYMFDILKRLGFVRMDDGLFVKGH